jgi:hypothetical protein
VFARVKAARKHWHNDFDLNFQLDHIIRVFRGDEMATIRFTTGGSWEQTGFDDVKRENTCYCYSNEHKIRTLQVFAELGRLDYSEVSLSARTSQ